MDQGSVKDLGVTLSPSSTVISERLERKAEAIVVVSAAVAEEAITAESKTPVESAEAAKVVIVLRITIVVLSLSGI